MSVQYQVPATPRVISPSPTPSERSGNDGYFPPQTRSKTAAPRRPSSIASVETIEEHEPLHEEDPELSRARSRSRSPQLERKNTGRPMNGGITTSAKAGIKPLTTTTRRKKPDDNLPPRKQANGFLSPDSAYPRGFGSAYWRNLSRSPSPLGLIPIHREWKRFIHKHEIPRKFLHVSIGFVTLLLYADGLQQNQIHPLLFYLFVPILATDLIRFKWDAFNRFYIQALGSFMRESEAHDRFNGVISYLGGLWFTMRFCNKDVAVMSVLLLSWCDTAASTFGRLWGKYTPRIRKGKSLAGSLAAFTVGMIAAGLFWGVVAPWTEGTYEGAEGFAFQGTLTLPLQARERLHLSKEQASISGPVAIGVVSVVSGFIVSASEVVDLFHLDDNVIIPVLCGIGLSAFLWVFGGS